MMVRAALGLHPYHADGFSELVFAELGRLSRLPEVVAIGEIGLDYAKSSVPSSIQRQVFARLLILCRSAGKPCVVHCREAYEDLKEIIHGVYPQPPEHGFWGVVHCFSGNTAEAKFLKERGFALGVDGPVTYPKNQGLREALLFAGLQHLVLETDSPYLPPQSSRGKRNEPRAIPEIAAKLSEIFAMPISAVAEATTKNAEILFSLPARPIFRSH
jgi:TatD DNase family protein